MYKHTGEIKLKLMKDHYSLIRSEYIAMSTGFLVSKKFSNVAPKYICLISTLILALNLFIYYYKLNVCLFWEQKLNL